MISQEQFVNRVLDNFDRIHEKLDDQTEKITDLCTRMATSETNFKNHIELGKVVRETKKEGIVAGDRKFYIIIAGIGTFFGLVTALDRIFG